MCWSILLCVCVLRVDGTWDADGARVGDAQRLCVCSVWCREATLANSSAKYVGRAPSPGGLAGRGALCS
eukprot:438621-Prymnesium_polylepis.1